MAMIYDIERFEVLSLLDNDQYSATTATDGVDVSVVDGNALVNIDANVATNGTCAFTVQHNDVQAGADGDWANVDAALLTDPDTGEPATFTDVTDARRNQTLVLNLQGVRRYVRVKATIDTYVGEISAKLFARGNY